MRQGTVRPRPSAAALTLILSLAATHAGAVTGGNGFYTVRVEESQGGFGVGLYTVATGPLHPVTGSLGPRDILFGGTLRPGQSYTTLRSYTSGTDYLQNSGVLLLSTAPPTEILESFVAPGEEAAPIGDPNAPSGFVTTYRIGSVASAPDSLLVVQTIEAVGTSFNGSAVRIETAITNTGGAAVELGVRYLWDFRIGFDDGPTFREMNPDGTAGRFELSSLAPVFETYEIVDNNRASQCFASVNPTVPFFAVQGSVNGPAALAPTPPSRLDFAAWPRVSGLSGLSSAAVPQPSAFGYSSAAADITTCDVSLDDSATIYWWGDDASNALTLPPGGSVTLAAYLFGYLPGDPPVFEPPPGVEGPWDDPSCDDGIDNDQDGATDLDDPDCIPPPEDEGPFGDPTCEDGIDNDQDGATDLDDPDCAPPNSPPDCSAAGPTIEHLWPPNHKMTPVGITGVWDPDGDPVTISVTGVFQDEPLNGTGDGNTCPDGGSLGGDRALLRSERSGQRDGRVYHIAFEASDDAGAACSGSVRVCVPHDQSKGKTQCIDQGPVFDSAGSCAAVEGECLSRSSRAYGRTDTGAELVAANAAGSLRLDRKDPLRNIFPQGRLLPIQLGGGAYIFADPDEITGGPEAEDTGGGFLSAKLKGKASANFLPQMTLALALNTGLSVLGADALAQADLDGDGRKDALEFMPGFLGLVIDAPGRLGDMMTVEEALLLADEALSAGAARAVPGEPLARFVASRPGLPDGALVTDLVSLVAAINGACQVPERQPTSLLNVP